MLYKLAASLGFALITIALVSCESTKRSSMDSDQVHTAAKWGPDKVKIPEVADIESYEYCLQGYDSVWRTIPRTLGDEIVNLLSAYRRPARIPDNEMVSFIDPPFLYFIRIQTKSGEAINIDFCEGDEIIWIDDWMFVIPKERGKRIHSIVTSIEAARSRDGA